MSNFNIVSFKPKIVNDFFTDEEIKKISLIIKNKINKNLINNKEKYYGFEKNDWLGCFNYWIKNNEYPELFDSISAKIKKILKIDIDFGSNLVWQRYTAETGVLNPNVRPHSDHIDNGYWLCFTVPINNKNNWSIFVNNKHYDLKNNECLFFNVTNNIHWRPSKIFKDKEFYDVLIFRFFEKNNKSLISSDLIEQIEKQRMFIQEKYYY
jgi:hypothetical protein